MKKYILLFAILAMLPACDKDNFNNNNPFIPNYGFSEQINMDLPAYNQLLTPSSGIYYGGGGARGLLIFYTGSGYNAFDAACPNEALSPCSTLQIDGINAVCPCNEAEYSLFTGQSPGLQYPLKPYAVQRNGNVLTIYN